MVPDSEARGLVARLPAGPRALVLLARFDRPTGWWLLFWPGAWSVALAGGALRRWDLIAWLLVGSIHGGESHKFTVTSTQSQWGPATMPATSLVCFSLVISSTWMI